MKFKLESLVRKPAKPTGIKESDRVKQFEIVEYDDLPVQTKESDK